MTLPTVALGDPHVEAHNAERQAINDIQSELQGRLSESALSAAIDDKIATLPPSGGGDGEVRSDTVHPYTYMGAAATDTIETDPTWRIRRIATFAPFAVTEATGAWTDRLTLTYV